MKVVFKNLAALYVATLSIATPVIAEDEVTQEASAIDEGVTAEPEKQPEAATEQKASPVASREKAPVVAAKAPLSPIPEGADVSRGERFALDGKGFSIVAPDGWVVQKNLPRASLFVQARVPENEYPRNIAVVRFQNPKLINSATAEEFAERLVKAYPQVSSTIENYSLRNHQAIQMTDGREGILFYTDFVGSGRKMMQAHVLVSSETNHYLVTYTDVAEHFENPAEGTQFLAEAWTAMTSIELDSPNPVPSRGMEMSVAILLALALIITVFSLVRRRLAARAYKEFGNLDPGEGAELVPNSSPDSLSQPTTLLSQGVSAVAVAGGVPESEDINEDDDGIHSRMGNRLLKFRKKISGQPEQVDDLEFDSGTDAEKFKRGA